MLETFSPSFFKRLQQLKIHTRRSFLGGRQGGHLSLRRGHGLEFADYRLYTAGDDFRHIDWGVYGRSDRLYVRQFREEQDLNVIFLLDASGSMSLPATDNKFDLSLQLALALGYVALTDGDSITFSVLGQTNSPRYVGPKSLYRAANFLESIKPEGAFALDAEVRAAVQRQKIPGKCFLISDCLCDLEQLFSALTILNSRNFEVAILQILGESELSLGLDSGTVVVNDIETNEEIELQLDQSSRRDYMKALADHIEAIEKFSQKLGMMHILISTKEEIGDLVLKRLPELGLLK